MGRGNIIELVEGELTSQIIGGFYAAYRLLGFGYSEHVYSAALERELTLLGLKVSREVLVPVHYRDAVVAWQRLDMVVNDRIVIENKTGDRLHPSAQDQLFNYLRCTTLEVGLLFYFGPKPYFKRLVFTNGKKSAETLL